MEDEQRIEEVRAWINQLFAGIGLVNPLEADVLDEKEIIDDVLDAEFIG
jgi:uncharacterized protein YgfB (UPF0149 family)